MSLSTQMTLMIDIFFKAPVFVHHCVVHIVTAVVAVRSVLGNSLLGIAYLNAPSDKSGNVK